MPGRKRKPDHLKVVAGTDRPDRMNPNAPVASTELPEPPRWLSARAAEIFRGLVATIDGMGIASADDTTMLALAASRYEEVEICTAVIEDVGRVYKSVNSQGAEMWRSRPEVAQRSEAMRHAQSLLAEFGLSPAARSRVSATPKPEQNPFRALG